MSAVNHSCSAFLGFLRKTNLRSRYQSGVFLGQSVLKMAALPLHSAQADAALDSTRAAWQRYFHKLCE